MQTESEVEDSLRKAEVALEEHRTLRDKTNVQNLNEIAWLYYVSALKSVLGKPAQTAGITTAFAGRLSKEGRYLDLRKDILDCKKCRLGSLLGGVAVPGNGDLRASLVVVGEAPGSQEVHKGYPFVDTAPAGKIIRDLLSKMDLANYFMCNAVNCRPVTAGGGNDKPSPLEVLSCREHFNEQLFLVDPKVVLAVGGTAGQLLSGKDVGITKMRGSLYWYYHYPVVVTWHPSYVARAGGEDTPAWEQMLLDIRIAERLLGVPRAPNMRDAYEAEFKIAKAGVEWR